MVIDRGHDFPAGIQEELDTFGADTWLFRDNPGIVTTRAVNAYKGDFRRSEQHQPPDTGRSAQITLQLRVPDPKNTHQPA